MGTSRSKGTAQARKRRESKPASVLPSKLAAPQVADVPPAFPGIGIDAGASGTRATSATSLANEAGQALRQRAETVLRKQAAQSLHEPEALSPEAALKLLHEISVHQIELETQNEELRRSQLELDAARSRYFDLYDLAPVGYFTLSEKSLILEANLAAANLLGVARGMLLENPISRFVLKEDQDVFHLRRKQLVETGEPQAWDLRMVKSDGTQFWAHLAATVVRGVDGATVLGVMLSDITERKRAQDALDKFFDQPMNLHLIADLDGVIRRANKGWEFILGYDRHELEGSLFLDLIHPDDVAATRAEMARLAQGISTFHFENRYRHRNGEFRHLAWSASVSAVDRLIYAVASDVTQRMQADLGLRKFKAIVDSSDDAIISKSLGSVIRSWNRGAEKIFGYTAEEAIGKSMQMLIPAGRVNDEPDILGCIARGESVEHFETVRRHRDGRLIDISATISPIMDENGKVIGASEIAKDISARIYRRTRWGHLPRS
ncbi:MAG: PAS domain S-box protein [Pseudomonadota bacterium]